MSELITQAELVRGGVAGPAGPAKAGPLFRRSVGLISRLQRRSANEMVGPGVPRKLAFAQCVGVSRINSSRCFASRSCRSPARPDRTASAPTFC